MQKMVGVVYSPFVDMIRDGFTSGPATGSVFLASIAVILLIVVQLFVVQWLWNTVLTRVVTGVKPLPSLLYTLGLLVLVAMVLPGAAAA